MCMFKFVIFGVSLFGLSVLDSPVYYSVLINDLFTFCPKYSSDRVSCYELITLIIIIIII